MNINGDRTSPHTHTPDNRKRSFLESMTFATMSFGNDDSNLAHRRQCACDECGVPVGSLGPVVPNVIQKALEDYRRKHRRIQRTQKRSLLWRADDGCSIWHWTLPEGAEPLLEFGDSSYRLVFVQRLQGILQRIGTGVIGSAAEEDGRVDEDWGEGDVIFVPPQCTSENASFSSTAVAWVLRSSSDSTSNVEVTGPAVLFIIKVPVLVASRDETCASSKSTGSWSEEAGTICSQNAGNQQLRKLQATERHTVRSICLAVSSDEVL